MSTIWNVRMRRKAPLMHDADSDTVYSPETPISLQLLAAHLYYRALLLVPSLIRTWLSDCRDRQLSGTVMTYTSTYFSPAIIRAELAQVKDPVLAGDLGDETFTVKVAATVHEITASYAVDEYALELKLKMPADWPLHTIVTKDSNRVGVSEDRWRSWILGVQQILTFRVRSSPRMIELTDIYPAFRVEASWMVWRFSRRTSLRISKGYRNVPFVIRTCNTLPFCDQLLI